MYVMQQHPHIPPGEPSKPHNGWVLAELLFNGTTPYASCYSCSRKSSWYLHRGDAFLRPTELLKHLMDHKLAGHYVPDESFEQLHKWLNLHQADTF